MPGTWAALIGSARYAIARRRKDHPRFPPMSGPIVPGGCRTLACLAPRRLLLAAPRLRTPTNGHLGDMASRHEWKLPTDPAGRRWQRHCCTASAPDRVDEATDAGSESPNVRSDCMPHRWLGHQPRQFSCCYHAPSLAPAASEGAIEAAGGKCRHNKDPICSPAWPVAVRSRHRRPP